MSKKEKDEGEINSVEIDTMAHKWSFFFTSSLPSVKMTVVFYCTYEIKMQNKSLNLC